MIAPWNLDGRRIVNWKNCAWRPYPGLDGGEARLAWRPIRAEGAGGDGCYLLRIAPGGGACLHEHSGVEEFVMLEGELIDGDGTVLRDGDCVSYDPGTRHRTVSPDGCVLLASIQGPIGAVDGDEKIGAMRAGRRIANWREADYTPYPSQNRDREPLAWHPVRADADTGEGFYLVAFPPGAGSAPHRHTGVEEFVMLEGELTDPDGTTYVTGDCVSLPPGSMHYSRSEGGCVTAAMIGGPLHFLA